MGRIRIGPSGWNYQGWRGDFYPNGLSTPKSFRRWYQAVPAGFVFAVKGSRFITHNKKLEDVEGALANFFAQGVLELDDKLGPILWQLSTNLYFDAARVDDFLGRLPKDTERARCLARQHDDRIEEAAYGSGDNHRLRHVLEVRHESYLCDEMVSLARRHGVALCFSHSSEWPYFEEITAGFVYLRLHGPERLYGSPYGEDALRRWTDRVAAWHRAGEPGDAERITDRSPPERKERDVYVYFDNDEGGHAPREAAILAEMLE
jgi:uncharacterized protein YecE (DUF72 family)